MDRISTCSSFMGHISKYPVHNSWYADHRDILSQRKRERGPALPLALAYSASQFFMLSAGRFVCRCDSCRWNAYDTQDLCLCLDGGNRLSCHEERNRAVNMTADVNSR